MKNKLKILIPMSFSLRKFILLMLPQIPMNFQEKITINQISHANIPDRGHLNQTCFPQEVHLSKFKTLRSLINLLNKTLVIKTIFMTKRTNLSSFKISTICSSKCKRVNLSRFKINTTCTKCNKCLLIKVLNLIDLRAENWNKIDSIKCFRKNTVRVI